MTEQEIAELIDRASKNGAKAAVKELKKNNLAHKQMDTYKKTEYILRNYNEFKKAVADRNEQISDINSYGIKKKSSSITSYPGGTRYVTDDYEKAEEQIATLEQENERTVRLLERVDKILAELKNEPYFETIEKCYFEKKKYEVIAGEIGVSVATVSTSKRNLLEKIRIRLFTDELIRELLEN